MTFEYIVGMLVNRYVSFQSAIERHCQNRNESIEVIIFSGKRPGIDYSSIWLYYYALASRCLHSTPAVDAMAKLILRDGQPYSRFDEVVACCRWVPF